MIQQGPSLCEPHSEKNFIFHMLPSEEEKKHLWRRLKWSLMCEKNIFLGSHDTLSLYYTITPQVPGFPPQLALFLKTYTFPAKGNNDDIFSTLTLKHKIKLMMNKPQDLQALQGGILVSGIQRMLRVNKQ